MPISDNKNRKKTATLSKADAVFEKAMSRAVSQELRDHLLRRSKRLLPFDDVKERLELWFGNDIGICSVPLEKIIGSQGRYKNFTRHFLPLDENLRTRWKEIEVAMESGRDLPPVELYKVCNAYFVKDGHHRISVARALKKGFIEARVYEYSCDLSLDDKTDLEQLAILETYHKFLKETGLNKKTKPGLHLTVLGGYPILMEHIQRHRFYLEKKEMRQISLQEAALSWFDKIYTPLKALIVNNRILERFPHRTETDFYIWISKYEDRLFQEVFISEKGQSVVESYKKKAFSPLQFFMGRVRRFLGRVKY